MNKMILCVGLVLYAQSVVAGDTPLSLKASIAANPHTFAKTPIPKATVADPMVAKRTSKNQLYFIAQEHSDAQFFLNFKEFKGNANAPDAPISSEVKWENEGEVWFRSSIGRGYISDTPQRKLADQKALVKEILKQAESFKTECVLATFRSVEALSNGTCEQFDCLIPLVEFKELLQAAIAPAATKLTPSGVVPKAGDVTNKPSETPKKFIVASSSLQPKELTSVEPTSFSFNNLYVKIGGALTLSALVLFCYFKYIATK